jgi:23S rRNA-/tRNA-specific pseudouridylate synthase
MVAAVSPPRWSFLGVCPAVDQRLAAPGLLSETAAAAANASEPATAHERTATDEFLPRILCVGNLRHVAPYFLQKELPVGKLAGGKRLGQALGLDDSSISSGQKSSSVVKNVALRDWWTKELIAGRLTVTDTNNPQQQQQQGQGDPPKSCIVVATPDHLIREVDVLRGRYHFHEQSVLDRPRPTIVYRDGSYIVVNKPGGIDVLSNPDAHRVVNSLPGMATTTGFGGDNNNDPPPSIVFPAHRIDNPVSGLVCCGRTPTDTKRLSRRIQSRETTKTYLARVIPMTLHNGIQHFAFPMDVEPPLSYDGSTGCSFVDDVHGKPARTTVLAVLVPRLDDGTCVVAVRPHTGRKHQLRNHLAHIGLPIANDEKYNPHYSKPAPTNGGVSAFGLPDPPQELVNLFGDRFVEHCDHCQYARRLLATRVATRPSGREDTTTTTLGPTVSQPIWLHSWRYEFPTLGLSFTAPPPEWACADQWKDSTVLK